MLSHSAVPPPQVADLDLNSTGGPRDRRGDTNAGELPLLAAVEWGGQLLADRVSCVLSVVSSRARLSFLSLFFLPFHSLPFPFLPGSVRSATPTEEVKRLPEEGRVRAAGWGQGLRAVEVLW